MSDTIKVQTIFKTALRTEHANTQWKYWSEMGFLKTRSVRNIKIISSGRNDAMWSERLVYTEK